MDNISNHDALSLQLLFVFPFCCYFKLEIIGDSVAIKTCCLDTVLLIPILY